jgi:phosphatidylglycerophosphate synthase
MAPVLMLLVYLNEFDLFKWLLPISYFTDLIDGFLARKLKVQSVIGSRLDSIGDDLTVVASLTGLIVFKTEFIKEHAWIFGILFVLFATQILGAFIRYKKTTSFHTYFAKLAALLQGTFLCAIFIFPHPLIWLFYLTAIITFLELVEEIILTILLPKWETDVKGLFWVLKKR